MYKNDPVLVLSGKDWNHGIVGIVAAKILEKYKKPAYVLQEMGASTKGSARSFGGFSAVAAIRASDDIITKGGGHTLAAGVTLPTKNIGGFRKRVNEFYKSLKLTNQEELLLARADILVEDLSGIDEKFVAELAQLEPFGSGNPEPILRMDSVTVTNKRLMGADNQHVKLEVRDGKGKHMNVIAFSAPSHFFVEPGEQINILFQPGINEWQGRVSVEGRLLHVELL
jgi:single-stranded-DNA-specific exonuclease